MPAPFTVIPDRFLSVHDSDQLPRYVNTIADKVNQVISEQNAFVITLIPNVSATGKSAGYMVYQQSDGDFELTDAANIGTSRTVGVVVSNDGPIGIPTGYHSAVRFTTAGGQPDKGAYVYLAKASADTNTGAGKLTATAPTGGDLSCIVGICVNNTDYTAAKTCGVVFQVHPPVTT